MPDYTIRIFKAWGARDARLEWVNTYEVRGPAGDANAAAAVAQAIADAEKLIHRSEVQFLRATISTWRPDSKPYNPGAFKTIELAGVGALGPLSAATLNMNVAYMLKFQAAMGRSGRRFYRGCLGEPDVETTANLSWQVSAGSSLHGTGTQFVAFRNALSPYLAVGAEATKIMLLGKAAPGSNPPVPEFPREVEKIEVGGVVVSRHDHRYFDRA